jgi:RimJ/RimL family protein N-acetyltransferase
MDSIVARGLCIRPFRSTDATAFVSAALESLETVGAWMPWCHDRFSVTDANGWFEKCAENLEAKAAYDVGILTADEGEFLGGVSINQMNRQHNFGNIGYWVRQSRQRQGVASRAVQTIAEFGFRDLQLTRLEIVAPEGNVASRGVAEKVGASFECFARNRLLVRGKASVAAVYSLVPEQCGF